MITATITIACIVGVGMAWCELRGRRRHKAACTRALDEMCRLYDRDRQERGF